MAFDLSDYTTVAERMAELREKHPGAYLAPLDDAHPYRIEEINGQTFVVVVAGCWLDPERSPGVGMAWEPVPGLTPYTKNSDLQNAETSAWGRAIVAALVADTSKSVASQDEVRNRQRDRDLAPPAVPYDTDPDLIAEVQSTVAALDESGAATFKAWKDAQGFPWPWPVEACTAMLSELARIISADAIDLASTPCALCGSTRSRRVLGAGDVVRCSETKGCEERVAALESEVL